jgi:hypothetical protein
VLALGEAGASWHRSASAGVTTVQENCTWTKANVKLHTRLSGAIPCRSTSGARETSPFST